jgi:tRNA-dihydrouridine synthase A
MMDRTDRHFRYLVRQLAPHARLYTEMLTARALLHGDAERLLAFAPAEHPVALQLGGSEPDELAVAAKLGAAAGYDEINFNVGCPSDRVQAGCFGAALMLDPERVADCIVAMHEAVSVPVTVKTRLGVDQHDSYEFFRRFVDTLVAAGCTILIVHARKAWLSGLSPKENREIPPLDFARVYRLKSELPWLTVVVNGGLTDAGHSTAALAHVDGIMLGRAAYQQPWLIAELDRRLFGGARPATRADALARFVEYIEAQLACGTPLRAMTRHALGLFAGLPGGRRWRRELGSLPDGAAGLEHLRRIVAAQTVFAADRAAEPGTRSSGPRSSGPVELALSYS